MKFKIKVKDIDQTDEQARWEYYDKSIDDPDKFGREVVEYFNNTLRPHEKKRMYLGFEVIDADTTPEHDWEKTNLTTISGYGGRHYDTKRCTRCKITGRMYTLGYVQRDNKYKAKVYERCDTAKSHIFKKMLGKENQ